MYTCVQARIHNNNNDDDDDNAVYYMCTIRSDGAVWWLVQYRRRGIGIDARRWCEIWITASKIRSVSYGKFIVIYFLTQRKKLLYLYIFISAKYIFIRMMMDSGLFRIKLGFSVRWRMLYGHSREFDFSFLFFLEAKLLYGRPPPLLWCIIYSTLRVHI